MVAEFKLYFMVRCETSEILQIFVYFILKLQPTVGQANGNRRREMKEKT